MAVETPICNFGWIAPDFTLTATDGRIWSRDQLCGPRGLLVMFLCNHCPYVQAVIDRIVRDVAEAKTLGFGAVGVMSNDTDAYPEDGFDRMAAFAAQHRFNFPYLIDPDQSVARAYDAVCTPDFFAFDSHLGLQYRGRLDASRKEALPNARRDLVEALRQISLTGQGPREQWPSLGCSIKWRG